MCARKWVVVIAISALVACATARPGQTEQVEPSKTSNEIQPKQEEARPSDAENTVSGGKVPEEGKNDASVVEATTAATKAELTEASPSAFEPVNEQYPHAVLFGGTCGGSIISPTWVLTAGHCTLFSAGRYVLAGTNNSQDDTGVKRYAKRLVIHPRFSVGPYWLDAARFNIKQVAANWDFLLVELDKPLPLDGKTMAAVRLDDGPTIPEGLDVGYAGYGTATHGDVMRDEMHAMELRVMPDSKCKEALEQYEAEDMICTQGRPPRLDSACNGDSGSGLVANGTLYGVASWVEDDAHRCFNGALVVFSRVSAVRDWIRQVTRI